MRVLENSRCTCVNNAHIERKERHTSMSTNAIAELMTLTDVREKLKEAGELAIQAAEHSAEFRQDFASIGKWWSGAHPQPERLLAILYLRAQEHAGFGKALTEKDLVKRANRADAMQRSTERNALQRLATDLDTRIRNSTSLSRRLSVVQEELSELAPDMEEIARKLVPILREYGVRTAEATAGVTAESTVTSNAWSCWFNGVRISCWLAVAIVLLVMLL